MEGQSETLHIRVTILVTSTGSPARGKYKIILHWTVYGVFGQRRNFIGPEETYGMP